MLRDTVDMYIVCIVFYFPCGVYPMWAKTSHVADVQEYPSFSMTISKVCQGKTVRFTAVQDMKSACFSKIPTVSATVGQETASQKRKARDEWLRLLLRTREITDHLKQRIGKNNIYLCDLHFKSASFRVSFRWYIFSITELCKGLIT